eukprot:14446959-Alexandrium_andersonii.AAC.1
MTSALLAFYMSISSETFVPDHAAKACQRFLLLFSSLAREASAAGMEKHWAVKPKFHLFAEMAQYQTVEVGNPRSFWAYKDEDFVGWIAGVASSRGGPVSVSSLPLRAIERYR